MIIRFTHSILTIMALGAAQNSFGAPAGKGAGPLVISAKAPSEKENDLFYSIVKKDVERRQAQLEVEIFGIEGSLRNREDVANVEFQASEKQHRERVELVLKDLLTPESTETPAVAGAEARFKLATLKRTENPTDALALLDASFEYLGNRVADKPLLAANILLSSGEIALQLGNKSKAQHAFERASDLAKGASFEAQELRVRALLGLGDTYFSQYRFEQADAAYFPAQSIIQKAGIALRRTVEPFLGPVLVRRFWANFRSGRYAAATDLAYDFTRQRPLFQRELPAEVMQDVVRSAGIAISELRAVDKAEKLARDPLSGELGKDMVVATLFALLRSGRLDEVEQISRKVDSDFIASRALIDYMSLRFDAARQAGKPGLIQEIATTIAERMAYNSQWRRANLLDQKREEKRAELVARAADEAAELAYREGRKTGSRLVYQKAFHLLSIRLQEFVDGGSRGSLQLRAGQVALLAGNLDGAESATRGSLAFPLVEAERKTAYHQMVEIALQRAQITPSAFDAYLSAVDAFARAFPEDPAARLALFESARKQESKGQTTEARLRLERLLANAQSISPFDDSEKERVTLALLALNARDSDTARSSNALGDLERQVAPDDMPKHVLSKIQTANAAAIRAHAKNLRENGNLLNAANAEMQWAVEHGDNPETPFVLRDAAQSFFELGELGKTREAASLIVSNFPKHVLRSEALYWQGRAMEGELAFLPAANAYVAAAFDNGNVIAKSQRMEALNRAQRIFAELDDRAWNARLLDKIASINSKSVPVRERARQTLQVAKAYRDAQRFAESERSFASVMRNDALPAVIRWEAELGLISTRIRSDKELARNRARIDDFAVHVSTVPDKKTAVERTRLTRDAVILALETDLSRATELPLSWASPANKVALEKLSGIEKAATRTFGILKRDKGSEKFQDAALLLAKVREKTADHFAHAASYVVNSAPGRADSLAQMAERYRIAARQSIFGGLGTDPSRRATAATALASLESFTDLLVEPQLAMIEPTVNSSPEVVRTVLETRIRTEEKK